MGDASRHRDARNRQCGSVRSKCELHLLHLTEPNGPNSPENWYSADSEWLRHLAFLVHYSGPAMKKTVFIVVVSILLLGGVYFGSSQKPDSASAVSEAVPDSTCRSCHKSEATQFGKTNHSHIETNG